jgi:AcrR family transcriptional regulator
MPPKPARKPKTNKRVVKSAPRSEQSAQERRTEVLEAALALIAEHGVTGASLRKLASELGMSQPSLYHYFASKAELIEEIVRYCAERMLDAGATPAPPKNREDIARFCKETVLALYASETHPRFIRFLFVVAFENAENRSLIQKVFRERLSPGFALLAEAFARDASDREELRYLSQMVVYAIGFPLLEQRALFREPKPSSDVLQYAEWVKSAAERILRSEPAKPQAGKRR